MLCKTSLSPQRICVRDETLVPSFAGLGQLLIDRVRLSPLRMSTEEETMSLSCLEDLPAELFFSIFDYFSARELFHSFDQLNSRLDQLLSNSHLHVDSTDHVRNYRADRVVSLVLTDSSICLDDLTNLRSLTLIRCNPPQLPSRLTRLSIENVGLSSEEIGLIFSHSSLIHLELNLRHQVIYSSERFPRSPSDSIVTLTINYIVLNDLVQLLRHLPRLKDLHVSLFGLADDQLASFVSPVPSTLRVTCVSLEIPFDVLCSQFLSRCFPRLQHLSVYTSFVNQNLLIRSLEEMLSSALTRVKKLYVSAQFRLDRQSTGTASNLDAIATRFRTAFWLKRNCHATFKCCHNDTHIIRLYLQTRAASRVRPSRFGF